VEPGAADCAEWSELVTPPEKRLWLERSSAWIYSRASSQLDSGVAGLSRTTSYFRYQGIRIVATTCQAQILPRPRPAKAAW
jgi:hypothetical protein